MANYGYDPNEEKFNQAGALNPAPVVAGVGSTPQTDQTNLSVAAAMERGDNFDRGFQPQQTVNALRASRDVPDMISNAVTARQQALAEGLRTGVNPDAPAITISPKQRQSMVQELHSLSQVAYQNSVEKAHATTQAYKQQRDTEAANDYVGFIHDLNSIEHPIGSAEHAAAASRVFEDHPLALQTTAGREAGMLHARVHDTASSLVKFYPTQEAAFAENPGATLEQDPRGRGFRVTRTRGIVQPETMVANEATKNAAKLGFTPDEFLNAEVAAGSNASGKWIGDANGKQIQIKTGDKTSVMDMAKFNAIKRGLQTKSAVQGNVAPSVPVLKYDKASGTLIQQ